MLNPTSPLLVVNQLVICQLMARQILITWPYQRYEPCIDSVPSENKSWQGVMIQRHIKTLLSARKICLMQFYPLYHHGICAEPSHWTFDFSTHDHHIKAFEDSHSSTQYWVQVIRIPGTGRKAISEYHEQIWHWSLHRHPQTPSWHYPNTLKVTPSRHQQT